MQRSSLFAALLFLGVPAHASAYDPQPWLADLSEARRAVDSKYANHDWLTRDRGFDLDAAFQRAGDRLRVAGADAEARRIMERLFERFRDGHVAIRWPVAAATTVPAGLAKPLCARLGYDAAYAAPGTADRLDGYRPLGGGNVFPAGTISVGGRAIGTIRIALFMPQGYPALCEEAVGALKLIPEAPCDEKCADAVLTHAYRRFTSDLAARLLDLKAAGAEVLLVDIGTNGGGSEWAEAAARMVTDVPVTSGERGFVRGPHWAEIWRAREAEFRDGARAARGAERGQLLTWANQARNAAIEAERPCPGNAGCERLARAGFATGMVGSAPAGAFAGKPWADSAFSISQHAYIEGAWKGPVMILTDQETWSAAEEFAAVLQDNRAAIVIGARTGGAGCGHVNGGTPTTLTHSKGVLSLPDCARFRRDGSNEVNGILPDVPVALRHDDGPSFKARLLADRLPEAVGRAIALRNDHR